MTLIQVIFNDFRVNTVRVHLETLIQQSFIMIWMIGCIEETLSILQITLFVSLKMNENMLFMEEMRGWLSRHTFIWLTDDDYYHLCCFLIIIY